MGVTEGTVKIRVEMTGNSDSAVRAAKAVREEVDKTTESSGALGESTTSIKDKIDGLKSSQGGLNAVREGFEFATQNAGFLIATVGGIAGAIISVVTEIYEMESASSRALKKWERAQGEVNKAITESNTLYDETLDLLLGRSPDEWTRNADALEAAWSNLNKQISLAQITAKELHDDWEDLQPVLNKLNTLLSTRADLERLIAERLERQRTALAAITTKAQQENEKDRKDNYGYQTDPFPKDDPEWVKEMQRKRYEDIANNAPDLGGGGGGGGRRKPVDIEKRFEEEVKLAREAAERAKREAQRYTIIGSSSGEGGTLGVTMGGRGMAANDNVDLMRDATSNALQLADALRQVADATRLVADEFPEMGAALTEVQEITAQVTAGKMSLTQALFASGVAIAANVAKSIGGVRAEAAVRGAYEFGMGWATAFTNPAESAGHFIASGALIAVAAGAGSGGGSGATRGAPAVSSRATRVSTASSLTDGGNVQNINAPWFGGLQEGGAYLWDIYQRTQGTGFAEAA